MSFNSFNFWLVYPLIFGIYWLIPPKFNQWRKIFLVLTSYILYMNWKPAFALILLGVTLVTYIGGLFLEQTYKSEENKSYHKTKYKRILFYLFVFLGGLPLLVFKYYSFINDNILAFLKAIGLKFSLPGLNAAIPVGISFFTFQAVGYLLDVYHGRANTERNLLDYVLFVAFFPQLLAGPISTSEILMPQIKTVHSFDYKQGRQGLKYLLWGMFIKLVIADRLGMFVDLVYANYRDYIGGTCVLAIIFYSIQIYCDFSGYSLMAIGIARTLGFNLPDNFCRPYLAVSITDFWHRWHITLTRWLTRHVYIPLGGSHCSKLRTYCNIFITFLVSGIWHGANWTFIMWGCIHGVLQIIEKALGMQKYAGRNSIVKICRILLTYMLVSLAWVFFRMPDIGSSFDLLKHICLHPGMPNLFIMGGADILMAGTGVIILIFKELKDEFFISRFAFLHYGPIRWAIYVILFCMIINFGVLDGGQFIYVGF